MAGARQSNAAASASAQARRAMAARRQRAGGGGGRGIGTDRSSGAGPGGRGGSSSGDSSSTTTSSTRSISSSTTSSSTSSGAGRDRAGRGGGRGAAAARVTWLLSLLVAASLAPGAAAAPRCAMYRCARCQLLPAAYRKRNNPRPGLQRVCVKPAIGYALSSNRRTVPFCAGGYVAAFKGGPCRRCKEGTYAPRNTIGTKGWRKCKQCPTNTASNRVRSKCVAAAGFYGNGKECPVNYYCANGSPWQCPSGSSTGGETGQTSCNYVAAGYYWSNGVALPCPINTYSSEERTREDATDCDSCTTGLTTGGRVASTSCTFILPGYYRNGNAAAPCPADTYLENKNQPFSSAPTSCTACAPGFNTNGATTQASCLYVGSGYYSANGTVLPCPVNTFRTGNALASSSTSCSACPTGLTTGGTTGNAVCGFVKAGFYNSGSATSPVATPCPANTAAPVDRRVTEAPSCPPCANLTTNGLTGQLRCNYIPPGFFYSNATGAGVPCLPDQYTTTTRLINDSSAANCLLCSTTSPGLTTNNTRGATGCTFVRPGYQGNTNRTVTQCGVDTYSDVVRAIPSGNCTACTPTGTTTNGATGSTNATACAFIKAGYYNNPPPTINPALCPVNTYSASVRAITNPTVNSCTACSFGFTTNGVTGSIGCKSFILAGFLVNNAAIPTAAPCPILTYYPTVRSAVGATSCLSCSSNTNSTGCITCPCTVSAVFDLDFKMPAMYAGY